MGKKAKILLLFSQILLIPAFFFAELQGQRRQLEEDVVYMRNGSIIRGTITEQVPHKSVTIVTFDGTVFDLATTDIDKVVREPSRFTQIKVRYDGDVVPITYSFEQGWYKGYGIGLSSNESGGNITFQARAGYRWKNWLHTGIASGMDPYNAGLIVPIAAEVRGDLLETAVTPHYYVQGGYGFAANQSFQHRVYDGGLMYHAGVGLTFRTRSKTEYQITGGYKWQETYQEFEEQPPWNPNVQVQEPVLVTGNRNYRRIIVMLSLNF